MSSLFRAAPNKLAWFTEWRTDLYDDQFTIGCHIWACWGFPFPQTSAGMDEKTHISTRIDEPEVGDVRSRLRMMPKRSRLQEIWRIINEK